MDEYGTRTITGEDGAARRSSDFGRPGTAALPVSSDPEDGAGRVRYRPVRTARTPSTPEAAWVCRSVRRVAAEHRGQHGVGRACT